MTYSNYYDLLFMFQLIIDPTSKSPMLAMHPI